VYYSTNSMIKHPDVRGKKAHFKKFRVPMLMLKTVTFESHNSQST